MDLNIYIYVFSVSVYFIYFFFFVRLSFDVLPGFVSQRHEFIDKFEIFNVSFVGFQGYNLVFAKGAFSKKNQRKRKRKNNAYFMGEKSIRVRFVHV